jgi:hypothetical protein
VSTHHRLIVPYNARDELHFLILTLSSQPFSQDVTRCHGEFTSFPDLSPIFSQPCPRIDGSFLHDCVILDSPVCVGMSCVSCCPSCFPLVLSLQAVSSLWPRIRLVTCGQAVLVALNLCASHCISHDTFKSCCHHFIRIQLHPHSSHI